MDSINSRKRILIGLLLLSMILLGSCTATTGSTVASANPATSADSAVSVSVQPTATAQPVTLPTFNATDLAKYNGQNGNSAYIAVNGKVYDVTAVPQWSGGNHWGRFQAGRDLSEEIKQSPHGTAKLDSVPIVGLYQP